MKKRKLKGWIIGILIGLLVAIIKVTIKGGTFLEFSHIEVFYTLISFPIYGLIFGLLIDKLKIFKKWYKTFYLILFSSLFIVLYPWILKIIKVELFDLNLLTRLFFSLIFILVIELIVVLFIGIAVTIIYLLFKKRNKIWNVLNIILIWFTCVWFLINDMGENFNIGGANGSWYLYGDILLFIGVIMIVFFGLFKK